MTNRVLTLVAAMSVVAVAASCGWPESAPVNTAQPPANANAAPAVTPAREASTAPTLAGAELTKAAELFASKCATCHMRSGKGDPHHKKDGIPDFTDTAWHAETPDAEVRDAIENGKGKIMPAFGSRLRDGDVGLLVAYIRGFPERRPVTDEAPAEMSHGKSAGGAPSKTASKPKTPKPAEKPMPHGEHGEHEDHPHE